MKRFSPLLPPAVFSLFLIILLSQHAPAQERLCDTAFEDCRQPLWNLIDAETQGIDVAFWFMQDTSYVTKLVNRFNAGVPVRILVDPRANPIYAGNEQILNQLRDAGIPMRFKNGGGILHWKMMLFAGQNKVEFSGANFSPAFFVPTTPFMNYIDEAIYFTDDPSVVNSFKTKFDDLWTNTTNYSNYGNITPPLVRRYPTFPIDPAMNFPPGTSQDFFNRTLLHFNREQQKIDVVMYRITNDRYTNATINALNRGIPVRLITEQDEYRNPDRPWDSYNVDLLYNAGVQIRIRAHDGLNHEKAVLLYSQGMTIFGSSNWTGPSSNFQEEHNYFTTKGWIFDWFVDHFERKWNSSTETQPFTPLPPDPPSYISPANNSTGHPTTNMMLKWEGGRWAHKFDIYFGTDSNPPLLAADQFIGRVDNSTAESFTLPTLQPGTKYFWRIVSKTMANQTANGATRNFTTAGTPPGGVPPTVTAISPNSGSTAGGTAVTISGTNFLSGATVKLGGTNATNVNVVSSTSISATTPAHTQGTVNVVVTNTDGQSGTLTGGFTYITPPPPPPPADGEIVLWASEAPVKVGNWSVVADSTAAGGARIFNPDAGAGKISTPSASPVNYFEMTFDAEEDQPYRLWIRGKAQNNSPFNDSAHVQFSDSVTSSGSATARIGSTSSYEYNLEECFGCGVNQWGWEDNGWGVGVLGPLVYFQNSGTHTIRVQVREDGLSIDQIVLSPATYLNSAPGPTKNDNTILAKSGGGAPVPPPTVTSVSPNSGPTTGGTSVTISGTGFFAGATVNFGGSAATNVSVVSSASITASTPSHAAGSVNVVVSNSDEQSGMLAGGFTYTTAPPPDPAPTVTSISPTGGPETGGTSVTINGTGFRSGASVSFGSVPATQVNVVSTSVITATTPPNMPGAVDVVVTNSDGQSGMLAGAYTYAPASTTETILLQDDFNDNELDTEKWNQGNLFSGFTDNNLPMAEVSQRLEIGALLQNTGGSHYNGIRSDTTYDLTGAYCYVELVQPPAANTSADAMFTVGKDPGNYYRAYVEAGMLIWQKRIGGTKINLFTAAYNSVSHRYLRIRHDAATGQVVFETASNNGGSPGTWTERHREQWNTAAVPIDRVLFELKGGTWRSESNPPGKVIFDNFKAARP